MAATTQPQSDTRAPAATPASRTGTRLLDADPGLAARLTPEVRERLSGALRVGVAVVEAGPWSPDDHPGDAQALGLLVLDGLLVRDMSIHDRCSAELLGPGDLLRRRADRTERGPGEEREVRSRRRTDVRLRLRSMVSQLCVP
jgi:hypothetical protein